MVLLEYGCGKDKAKGYIGIDIEPLKDIDIVADAQNIPIRDKVINVLFTDQMLEHLEYPPLFLKECNRVLKVNHTLIISIPNRLNIMCFLRWMIKNRLSVTHDHIYAWTLPELKQLISKYGFKYIMHNVRTHERHYTLSSVEKMIRKVNKRIIDKNLIVRFEKCIEL